MISTAITHSGVAVTRISKVLLDFIKDENLTLPNDDSGIHICQNGVLSHLDLTFISPTLSAYSQ